MIPSGRRPVLRIALSFLVILIVEGCAEKVEPEAEAQVTQAQLDAEFNEAARAAARKAESIAADTSAFLAAIQPFGPLDLIVGKAASPDHASQLRNFFLGVVSGAAKIDAGPFASRWHCGPPCAQARRDTLMTQLVAVRELVEQFDKLRVHVLATWPDGGYRADSLVFENGIFSLVAPSPLMAFIPWRSTPVSDPEAAFSVIGARREDLESLLAKMRMAGIVAMAREQSGSIRAVLAGGITDNEAGLLFLSPSDRPPSAVQPKLWDGREYVGAEEVEPGVFFYVTT